MSIDAILWDLEGVLFTTGWPDRAQQPDERLFDEVRRLQGRVVQAVVSNGCDSRKLTQAGVAGLFQEIIISADVGASKPSPQIFLIAAERLDVATECCLVIDDVPENVAAASRLGMTGIVHVDAALTLRALRDLVGPEEAGAPRSP